MADIFLSYSRKDLKRVIKGKPRVRDVKKPDKRTNSQNFETFLGCLVFLALLAGVTYGGWQGGKSLGWWGVSEQTGVDSKGIHFRDLLEKKQGFVGTRIAPQKE
jgi:hypothetical protein